MSCYHEVSCVTFQYVSEVVIGAPYSVTQDLLDHFKVCACKNMFVCILYLCVQPSVCTYICIER